MNFNGSGRSALLAALVIGDQIRINRPGHKYRLTVEVETPDGIKIGLRRPGRSSRPRLQPRRPHHAPRAMPCSSISAAAKILWRCWRISTATLDLDGINYVALRAYNAAGRNAVIQRDEPA